MPSPEQIREARHSAGLTQEQAGATIGATRRAWQEWEAGRRNMPGAKWELFQIKTRGEIMERKKYIEGKVRDFFGTKRRAWATPGTDNHTANFYGDTWLCPLSRQDVAGLIECAIEGWTFPAETYEEDGAVLSGQELVDAAIEAVIDEIQFEKPQE